MSKRNLRNAESVKSVLLIRRAKFSIQKYKVVSAVCKTGKIYKITSCNSTDDIHTQKTEVSNVNCCRHMNDESWEHCIVEYIRQIRDIASKRTLPTIFRGRVTRCLLYNIAGWLTSDVQRRSQRGHRCMFPGHRRSIFVTAPLVFSRVSIFCPWTPLGTSVTQTPWFVPLSKFLATILLTSDGVCWKHVCSIRLRCTVTVVV